MAAATPQKTAVARIMFEVTTDMCIVGVIPWWIVYGNCSVECRVLCE